MSAEDILYTNKFTISNDENINSKYSKNKKVQFKNNYEEQYGVPNDLLNNNDNYLNDYYIDNNGNTLNAYNTFQQFQNNKSIKKTKKLKKNIISIDSKDRDASLYPTPSSFIMNLPKSFSNIYRITLLSTEFPNMEQVIRSYPAAKKNNKIYWQNQEDGEQVYSITITEGNYSSTKFSNELTTKMNNVERINATNTNINGVPHNFSISVNAIPTNIFELRQTNNVGNLSNPFSIAANSTLLTVTHQNHEFNTGKFITIAGATKFGGLDTSLINTTHLISVDRKKIDSIIYDSTNLNYILRIGTVNYTETVATISGTVTTMSDLNGVITGKVSTTKGSRIVTGLNTNFTTNTLLKKTNGTITSFLPIHIGNYSYYISNIKSNTELELNEVAKESFNGKNNLLVTYIEYLSPKLILHMMKVPKTLINLLNTLNTSITVNLMKYSDNTNMGTFTITKDNIKKSLYSGADITHNKDWFDTIEIEQSNIQVDQNGNLVNIDITTDEKTVNNSGNIVETSFSQTYTQNNTFTENVATFIEPTNGLTNDIVLENIVVHFNHNVNNQPYSIEIIVYSDDFGDGYYSLINSVSKGSVNDLNVDSTTINSNVTLELIILSVTTDRTQFRVKISGQSDYSTPLTTLDINNTTLDILDPSNNNTSLGNLVVYFDDYLNHSVNDKWTIVLSSGFVDSVTFNGGSSTSTQTLTINCNDLFLYQGAKIKVECGKDVINFSGNNIEHVISKIEFNAKGNSVPDSIDEIMIPSELLNSRNSNLYAEVAYLKYSGTSGTISYNSDTDYYTDMYSSKLIRGVGSITQNGSDYYLNGSNNIFDMDIKINTPLNTDIIGVTQNSFDNTELIKGNLLNSTGLITTNGGSLTDNATPISLSSITSLKDPIYDQAYTLPTNVSYDLSIKEYYYPNFGDSIWSLSTSTGSLSSASPETYTDIKKKRYNFKTNISWTNTKGNIESKNIDLESPKIYLVEGHTYTFNYLSSVSSGHEVITNDQKILFSTNNFTLNTNNSITPFTHSKINTSNSNRIVITVDSTLTSALTNNKLYYYASVCNTSNDSVENRYLSYGGYFEIVTNTDVYDNNKNYTRITDSEEVFGNKRLFLNGHILGMMPYTESGSITNVADTKCLVFSPNHRIPDKGNGGNDVVESDWYISIINSTNTARINNSNFEYKAIIKIEIPEYKTDGTTLHSNGDIAKVRVYVSDINTSILVGDTINIIGTSTINHYKGPYRVNLINTTDKYYEILAEWKKFSIDGVDSLLFEPFDDPPVNYVRGSGYINGTANHLSHKILNKINDHMFVIDYPYMGSELCYWGEVITGQTTSSKTVATSDVIISSTGSRFKDDITKNDKIFLLTDDISENLTIDSIPSNKQIKLKQETGSSLSSMFSSGFIFKNVTEHNLAENDNVLLLKDTINKSDDYINYLAEQASLTSFSNVTLEESDLLFDITDSTITSNGPTIGSIKNVCEVNISDLDMPIFADNTLKYERSHNDFEYYRHNNKYYINLNTTSTASAILKGGDSVSIGEEVKFSLLFSQSDTPGELLGFPNIGETTQDTSNSKKVYTDSSNNTRYLNLGDTEFKSVQSNTFPTDIINIKYSEPGKVETGIYSGNYTNFTKIETMTDHPFETGDIIFIENHNGSSNDTAINTDYGHVIFQKISSRIFYISLKLNGSVIAQIDNGNTANGIVYRKQLFKPFILSGKNYAYLVIKNIENNVNTSTKGINNVFAKLLLNGSPGYVLFSSFVSTPKEYIDGLLKNLDKLDIQILDPEGELYEFNNSDFSFSLEIAEVIDIVEGTAVSSRTGSSEGNIDLD